MNTKEVCRLCLKPGPEDLVWIFDRRIAEPGNMREVIYITTGVEIKKTDKITQKVCKKCLHITIKMFKFRTNATKNDKELKKLLEGSTITSPEGSYDEYSDEKHIHLPLSDKMCHPTLEQVLRDNPDVKVPVSCLQYNILPSISLDPNDVSRWFREKRKHELWKHKQQCKQEIEDTSNVSVPMKTVDDRIIIIDDASSETDESFPKDEKTLTMGKKRISPQSQTSTKKLKSSANETSICFPDISDTLLVKDSEDLSLCDICNKIFESEVEMKIHKRKHTTCPHCHKVLKTMNAKERHVKSRCHVHIKRNLPMIKLVKAECIQSLTTKYPEAFKSLSNKISETVGNLSKHDIIEDEVYCISDDDGPSKIPTTTYKSSKSSKNPRSVGAKNRKSCPVSRTLSSIDTASSNVTSTTVTANKNKNPLIPNIVFEGDSLIKDLDFTRDEVGLVKQLLEKAESMLPKPSVATVTARETGDKMYALENIVPYLKLYKVPIDIRCGSRLTVGYDFNPLPTEGKKIELWNAEDARKNQFDLPTSNTGAAANIKDNEMSLESLLRGSDSAGTLQTYKGPHHMVAAALPIQSILKTSNNGQLIPNRLPVPLGALNQQVRPVNLPVSQNNFRPSMTSSSSPNQLLSSSQVVMNNPAMQQNYSRSSPVILNSVFENTHLQTLNNLVNRTTGPLSNWIPQNINMVPQSFQSQTVGATTYSNSASSIMCGTSVRHPCSPLVNATNIPATPVPNNDSLLCQILSITSTSPSDNPTNTSTVVCSNVSIPTVSANMKNKDSKVISNKPDTVKHITSSAACSIAPKRVAVSSTYNPSVNSDCVHGPPPSYQYAVSRITQATMNMGNNGVTTQVTSSKSSSNNVQTNCVSVSRSNGSTGNNFPTIRVKPIHQLIGN